MGQIQKLHIVAMKAFQRGIFVVAVAGGKLDIFVFKVLDEVDGKETFADTSLAIKNQIKAFSHIVSPGGNCSTLAMRGPRDAKAEVSAGKGADFRFVVCAGGGVAMAGVTGAVFDKLAWLARLAGRRLADDLREPFSFK
jgi:hypothetical protein